MILLTLTQAVHLSVLAVSQHHRFGTFGFDTGIFAQGTWLLSQLEDPFVTIRGLDLFGDHASYILVFVAPLYALVPQVELLLVLQVCALVAPAPVIYSVGRRHCGDLPALAVAAAYLVYPAMNHAALWQFHPETLAAVLLAAAVLFADRDNDRAMCVALFAAMLCKEDVSLVVVGFGVFLISSKRYRVGVLVGFVGAAYFAVTTFVLVPLANGGDGSIYTARLYGIDGDGLGAVVTAAPVLLWNAAGTAVSTDGIEYLALVFTPMLVLPLLAPRRLLPVAGPMLLNLASTTEYQRSIEYQYLATSGVFIALAAAAGLSTFTGARIRNAVSVLLLFVASGLAVSTGPVGESWQGLRAGASTADEQRYEALDLVPTDAVVSAQANTVAHLANRREVYEFPNPFRPSNWGARDVPVAPGVTERVEYVLVDPASLGDPDARVLGELLGSRRWEFLYQREIILLHKTDSPGCPPPRTPVPSGPRC